MREEKPPEQEKSVYKQLHEASHVGIFFVVSIFVGLAIGYGLDIWLNTLPVFTIIFLIIGIIAGFRELLRVARKLEKQAKE